MDRTLAKLINDFLRLRKAAKTAYSPYLNKEVAKAESKITNHLHTHYQFEKVSQQNLDF